jgi:Na+/phosphate symporter
MDAINSDLKGLLERISGMCFRVESMLSLCMDGFMKHKIKLIDEAQRVSHAIHDEENELISLLSNRASKSDMDKELIKSMMAVVGHIEMATNGVDIILQNVRMKVDEGVLFSDKGVNEISHLFKETLGVLKTAGDAILTKNDVLKKYIADKYVTLNQTVDAYSEEHEDRLIKGVCQPKSSSVYLNIVDSLVKVVWHVKQAVNRFFGSR